MKKTILLFILALILSGIFSCGGGKKEEKGRLRIAATTTMIADAIDNIAKDKVALFPPLCGPGIDPHSYTATTKDIRNLAKADIIFYNGLRLEEQLSGILEKMKDKAIAISSDLPKSQLIAWESGGNTIGFDPHIWNNPDLWSLVIDKIASILSEKDPENKEYYLENSENYKQRINKTNEYAKEQIAIIPENKRILISSHDAFGYFAKYYGFKTLSILGISSQNEAGVQDIQNLADYIATNKIKTIFTETTVNNKSMKALQEAVRARGAEVAISRRALLSDAFASESPANTYIGMIRYNIDVIVEGLK